MGKKIKKKRKKKIKEVKMNEIYEKYIKMIKEGLYRKQPITDAPLVYHLAVFYTIVGALIGKSRYFVYGNKKIYPNLWTVLVGKTSYYRKSTSIQLGVDVLRRIDNTILLPSEFSLESLTEILSEKPEGLFWIDEFSNFFSQFHRSYLAGGLSLFLQLYESDLTIERHLIKGQFTIENPCVSILSSTTFEGITSSLKERELRTGLLPRFTFFTALKKDFEIEMPDVINYELKEQVMSKLKEVLPESQASMPITQDAIELYSCYTKKTRTSDANLVGFYSRANITFIKLFIIETVLRGKDKITADIVNDVLNEFSEIIYHSIHDVFYSLTWTPFQEKEKKVSDHLSEALETAKSTSETWVSRTDLIRATRLSSSELNAVINTMFDKDEIEKKTEKKTDSVKKVVFYRLKRG